MKPSDRNPTHITDLITADNIYTGDELVGSTLKRAYADATAWIGEKQRTGGTVGTMP